jgi:hypothetical protein
MDSSFKDTIREHLQLKESNRCIEQSMPLSRYRNHQPPSESGAVEQAADSGRGDILDSDETADWPTAETLGLEGPAALWSGPSEFDWGD